MKLKVKLLSYAITLALGGADSLALAAAPTANTKPLTISNISLTANPLATAVAGNGNGRFLAVWSEFVADPANQGQGRTAIFARYVENGFPVGDKFQLAESADATPLIFGRRFVAMDAPGDAVVCWRPDISGEGAAQISCRLVPNQSDSGLATPVFTVNDEPSQVAGLSVAMADDGDFIVVWQNYDSESGDTAVLAKRFAADGEAKENAFTVAEFSAPAQVSVAMNPAGDAVAVWQDGSQIQARRIGNDSSAEALPASFVVDLTPEDDEDPADKKLRTSSVALPSVAMDADGNFAVAWQRLQRDTAVKQRCTKYNGERYCEYVYSSVYSTGVFAQRFDAGDNPQNHNKKTGAAEDLTIRFNKKQHHGSTDIAMDASGNFVVGWQQVVVGLHCEVYDGYKYCEYQETGSSVFARKYSAAKNKLEAQKTVAKKSKSSLFNQRASVALANDGAFEVGWNASTPVSDYERSRSSVVRYFKGKKK